MSTGTGLWGNTMSIRLANFDHKASLSLREPHKLGENWLTTSQGTGWPQSYWYLNNLCIFIATTEHCGQKSGQTNNCFDFHVISDSDRVMIVIVMSLSQCLTTFLMSPSPARHWDTNQTPIPRVSLIYDECHKLLC